jgi:group I intron endonuclease
MSGIYKITNPKGKVYIGQSVNVLNREKYYKSLRCKNQTKIYNSLKKYGADAHVFEIICYCDVSQLNDLERYYQELYNVIDSGLNCRFTNTYDKAGSLSKETKEKIRKANIGKKLSEETKLKISENTKKGMTESVREKISLSRKNYKYSDETKLKISITSKGRFHSKETKEKLSVSRFNSNNPNAKIVLDYNTGVFYNTSKEASDILGIKLSTIRHYISGYIKQERYNLKYV